MAGSTLRITRAAATVVAVALLGLASGTAAGATPADGGDDIGSSAATISNVKVMRASRISPGELAAWYQDRTPRSYRARASLPTLTRLFIEEGRDEGVGGDLAFLQSVVETNWFAFTGRVPPSANNFSGLGATDGTDEYARFPSPRIGVRAQIQHLRAYADPTVTEAKLAHRLVDPRFDLVKPKGKARTWDEMGSGNWASDPDYGDKILGLYRDLLQYSSVSSFSDVPRGSYYARGVAWMERSGITTGVGDSGLYLPDAEVTRAELAAFLWRMMGSPRGAPDHGFPDVPRGSYYDLAVRYLKDQGVTGGVGDTGRYEPSASVTRGQMVTFLWRLTGTPDVTERHRFIDVDRDSYYDDAVSWASRYGITTGVGGTRRFDPDGVVTRAQMAAFLYRLVLEPDAWEAPLPPTAP